MNDAPSASVGVVLVTWNGWTYTVAAARSLDQSDYRNLKIIIVDKASSDDSLAQLRAALPHADIIAHPVNAGFSGGCNIGIRRAVEQGCAYVFLLNNDALVENSTIAKLVEATRSRTTPPCWEAASCMFHPANTSSSAAGPRRSWEGPTVSMSDFRRIC